MNSVLPILKKELKSFFNSPIAYIVVIFFLAFTSVWFFFIQQFFVQNSASLRGYFAIMPLVFTILVPALTMRSWAEERKTGTAELLITMPFTEGTIVIGKFLSSYALILITAVLTLPVPLAVSMFGHFDGGQIVGEYLGILLLGGTCVSIGLFVSANSKNQISAFIFTALILIVLTLMNQVTVWLNPPRWAASLINWVSINYHFEGFTKGVIDTRDLLYFVLSGALFLYLTTKALVFRKWR
jgi:ABC-2 type transport system permease protein